MFLHDAVFESLTCGSTQIPGWELSGTVARLATVSAYTSKSGYQHQFEVHCTHKLLTIAGVATAECVCIHVHNATHVQKLIHNAC